MLTRQCHQLIILYGSSINKVCQKLNTHPSHATQNNPLYLEAFEATSEEDILQFHHIVHCSLDAVESKCTASPNARCMSVSGDFSPGNLKQTFLKMHISTISTTKSQADSGVHSKETKF